MDESSRPQFDLTDAFDLADAFERLRFERVSGPTAEERRPDGAIAALEEVGRFCWTPVAPVACGTAGPDAAI